MQLMGNIEKLQCNEVNHFANIFEYSCCMQVLFLYFFSFHHIPKAGCCHNRRPYIRERYNQNTTKENECWCFYFTAEHAIIVWWYWPENRWFARTEIVHTIYVINEEWRVQVENNCEEIFWHATFWLFKLASCPATLALFINYCNQLYALQYFTVLLCAAFAFAYY